MSSPNTNNVTGVFLDADLERMVHVDLPLVTCRKQIFLGEKQLSSDDYVYGEVNLIGDLHYGNTCFSKSVVHGYLQYLKEHPNIMIGLMGDIIEYGEGSHYIREDEKIPIDDQIGLFIADFKQFANRIKFILWGNHEERYIRNAKSKRLMNSIALELGVDMKKCIVAEPQRGLFVYFKAGEKIYGAYVQHSKTQARINQDNQLRRAGSQNVVSLIAHGHTHRLGFKPRTFRALENINGQWVNVVRRQYLCATGCALKYPPYAEAASYPYTEVGFPILKFYADHDELDYYDLTNRYRPYLKRGELFKPDTDVLKSLNIQELNSLIRCPKCKGTDFQRRGQTQTATGVTKQRCQCACGKWFSYEVTEEE